ncbi:MAG: T9SS type A sorting domain-containing protein [Paludibacteraceae bacterium]|nr:T9SS type A sorting domain-containing protein [Paludibacteraceae bacterium]
MKKSLLLIASLLICVSAILADVTFTVNVPEGTQHCYVVGALPELSSWAAGSGVAMTKVNGQNQFVVTVAGITAEDISASDGYKYICGPDWKYVEVTASDGEMANRKIVGNPDVVAKWRNVYTAIGIVENWTIAGKQYPVQILLPSNYDASKEYHVTYMFGRHQRYRDAGSDTEMGDRILYSDSWGVAESVAELEKEGVEVGIIAVIYAQLPEFTPWENEEFAGTGQADAFLKGFVEEFKPAFEQKYAIASEKSVCSIMGADVAGLFAFYATIKYPNLFGRCVMFSPAFWYNSREMRNYVENEELALSPEDTHYAFVTTSADTDWTTDEIDYYSQWLYNKNYLVSNFEIDGAHDDRTWGKAFKNVMGELPLTTKNTPKLQNSTYAPKQSALHIQNNADITWYFMKGEGTTTLTCEGTPTQKGSFYKDGKTPTAAQLLIKEIPVDGKKYSYYWNLNNSSNCDGELLMDSPKDIGFKNTRSTTSWQRIAVFADGSYEQSAASSTNFKVNGITMTVGNNYEVSAEVSLTDSKVISVHYGSVNSGSDMGELVNATVSDNCLKAKVVYSYLTNKLTITETAWGSSDIDLEYFKVEPAVVHPGTPVKMSVKITNKNGYNVKFRTNHNNQPSEAITLTKGNNGEEYYIIQSPTTGIYGFYLDIELNGTTTKAHRMVFAKVVDGQTIIPILHQNPYREVDWSTIHQYKSNMHTHTTQSNDAIDEFTTANVVDKYHAAGYKILALTDHDYNPYPWQLFPQYMSSVPARDPEALGMLAVPGNELSKDNTNSWSERTGGQYNHHNDFFTGRQGQEFASLQESYAYTYALGGMQIINHPGQYWSIDNTYSETQKDGPGWHATNFKTFPSLVGLEVYNQGNRRPNDRILWDQILERTMPERPVFGYSGDDTHNNEQLFRNYNMMLMEDLTTDELKDAIRKGESYFCYEPKGSGEGKAPRITNIAVDEANKTITIETNGMVSWIYGTDMTSNSASSTRSSVVGIGNTFCYEGYQGAYVRAFITNAYGETCTQPFGFTDSTMTDVDNVAGNTELKVFVFPNPATDELRVMMNQANTAELISVYDITGKEVMRQPVEGAMTTLPVSQLHTGIYLLTVDGRQVKFIKD